MIRNTHDFVKLIVKELVKNPKTIVDMTLGNGHDSLWLKNAFPEAFLFGFDIQEEAIHSSKKRLEDFEKLQLIHDGHENISDYITEKVDFGIYNLGFLPGGDKSITTESETVISSLKDLLKLLKNKGLVLITCYPGHTEGKEEGKDLEEVLSKLDQSHYIVGKYQFLNQINNPPFVLSIQKIKEENE